MSILSEQQILRKVADGTRFFKEPSEVAEREAWLAVMRHLNEEGHFEEYVEDKESHSGSRRVFRITVGVLTRYGATRLQELGG
ncbi:hypothetical protein DFR29_10378 [Tahibacter aquaticus]|uniref:Uncharacterized protein n=1 Tax=Tahibacter aquaticus TaxID=520092 RepID=A0A4V3DN32_9GAMM|nr:hypothetical protein [Tahibacter aquaticus]TDR46546.1 hypothetical protein DFR29_10378 [Tahibacter aquaticus]